MLNQLSSLPPLQPNFFDCATRRKSWQRVRQSQHCSPSAAWQRDAGRKGDAENARHEKSAPKYVTWKCETWKCENKILL